MRILIFGLNYTPELTGIGKYTGEMAAWLAAQGHEVRVVAAPPYYPAWKVRGDYRSSWYFTERGPGQPTVFRTPLWVPARPSGWKRMVHLTSFMLGSLPVMLRQPFWKPQIVFTVEPTFFCAPIALFVAKLCRARTWLHVQDFEVDAAFDLKMLPSDGEVQSTALQLEAFFTNAFDRVSSISMKMVERSVAKGVSPQRVVLFPNWVDVNNVYPMDLTKRATSYRTELGLEGKVVLLYSGNMGAKQGLEMLPTLAAALANDPQVHFLLCGDGVFCETLKAMVKGMANVTMIPLQPLERLNDLLNTADIHLLPQRPGAADLVMPSKLTGMLSSGRPVIATAGADTQVAHVVQGRGLVVPTENHAALACAARTLVDNADLRAKLGAAAREYAVEHLGCEQVLQQFEKDAEAVILGPASRSFRWR